MDEQEVRWEHYPHVANHAVARAFVERLVLKGKRPKTVDAYARAIEDLLAYIRCFHVVVDCSTLYRVDASTTLSPSRRDARS